MRKQVQKAVSNCTTLRIDELLLKVISDVKRINQQYEVEMQFIHSPEDEKQCMVFGNFDLLYSAFKNIIENGCKYSPDKVSVVKVSFVDKDILIEVINHGDVIDRTGNRTDIPSLFSVAAMLLPMKALVSAYRLLKG